MTRSYTHNLLSLKEMELDEKVGEKKGIVKGKKVLQYFSVLLCGY